MQLSDHSLRQIDEAYLKRLGDNVTLGIFNPIHGFLGIFHRLRHFSIVSA